MKITNIIEKTLGSFHFVNGAFLLIASTLIILGFIKQNGYYLGVGLFIVVIDQRFNIKDIEKN